VDNKKKFIGNEMLAGSNALSPRTKQTNKRIVTDYNYMKARRQSLIDVVASPPHNPVAKRILPARASQSDKLNQISYNILIIAVLAGIGSVTNLINWEFLFYGIAVVLVRLPSAQMFMAAIVSLIIVPITSLLQKGSLSNNFSVMAFYFISIGLIEAALELRRESRFISYKINKPRAKSS
jgi:hypothetical protein